jgi:translocation and assembly module TamB
LTEPETQTAETPAKAARRRALTAQGWIIVVSVAAVVLVAMMLSLVRYGAVTPQGRMFVEARANGLKLGRIGRLRIEGIGGDLWSDFTVRRLTIVDERGAWLDARDVHVKWRYTELFVRRFHADSIAARHVMVVRRPTLSPKGPPSKAAPVSVDIDAFALRLEMLPEFSVRRGLYDVTGDYDMQRLGGQKGRISAQSLLAGSDHLRTSFDVGRDKTLKLVADVREANGGALAGMLGLAVDRPFMLAATADGEMSRGRFTVDSQLGSEKPLVAQGSWTPEGGAAQGRLALDASRFTRILVRMAGPTAEFQVSGRRVNPEFHALDLRVNSQNITVAARGRGNLGERRTAPEGLATQVAVANLERVVSIPAMGPARWNGVTRLDGADWSLEGQGAVERFSLIGYTLARLNGPVAVGMRRGELTIEASAAGRGGAGKGWLPILLGPSPKASATISRLKDGRFLWRRLDLAGAGIKAQGDGGRSLFGALTFKGDATVTDLSPVHAGAKGRLAGRWSASQASGGKPWLITVDARGTDVAAGFGEVDRLLGPNPTLKGRLAFIDNRFDIADARLDGGAAGARAAGTMGTNGDLKLKLDWTADGPFRVGPLEIAGKAKGDGALGGSLSAPRLDLAADFDQIDAPRLTLTQAHLLLSFLKGPNGTDGEFALNAASAYGPARAKSAFRFAPGGLELTGLDADAGGAQVKGEVSLRQGRPATADLALNIGPGAFVAQGRLSGRARVIEAAGGPRAILDLQARDVPLGGGAMLSNADVDADGPLARLPFRISADGLARPGLWKLAGSGVLSEAGAGYAVDLDAQGSMGSARVSTAETAQIRWGDGTTRARLRLAVGSGRADIDLNLAGATADLEARLSDVALGALNQDLEGMVTGRVSLQGRDEVLTGDLVAELKGARERGAAGQSLDGKITAALNDQTLVIRANAANAQGLTAEADFTLPAEAGAKPFHLAIDRTRQARGRFAASGEVKPIWDLLLGGDRSLSGKADIEASLSGTLADPRLVGRASLSGGRYEEGTVGLILSDVTLRATLADNAIEVAQASGEDGLGGTVRGSGRMSLRREDASNFRLDFNNFRLIDNEIGSASASGQATVNRAADGKVQLTGALTIDRADIAPETPTPSGVTVMDVVERNRPRTLAQATRLPPRRGPGMALDVTLKAPRRVFLKGRGLDIELSLDAHVTGTTNRPEVGGVARVVRGDYDFAGKRFEFDDHSVVYLASDPERIRLELTATREDPTLNATIHIVGTAARPEITLSSSPALPNDEVLSQVLFGASASQLSPVEAAQLASALSSLAGGGGFDVVGGLRNLARLDRLAFADDAAGGVTVAGGKYVTDDVYLEIIGGGRDGPAAQVEWRVRRNLSLVSRLGSQGDGKLSVRWRRDY